MILDCTSGIHNCSTIQTSTFGIMESSQTVIVVPQWKMRGEAKVTLLQAYCISLPYDTVLWTCTVFTRVLFRLRVSFWLWWMAKSSTMSAPSFA
jgi:hypothetical protein